MDWSWVVEHLSPSQLPWGDPAVVWTLHFCFFFIPSKLLVCNSIRLAAPEKSEGSGQLPVVDSYQRPDIGAPIRMLLGWMRVVIQLLAQEQVNVRNILKACPPAFYDVIAFH